MFEFRRLTVGSAGEALTLQRAAFVAEAAIYGTVHIPPLLDTIDDLRREVERNIVIGAFDAQRLIGSARLTVDGPVGWVSRVAVAPDKQGRGVGSALLQYIEEVAPAVVTELQLAAAGKSESNIGLYERRGYREFSRGPDSVGTPMVFMRKNRVPRVLLITGSLRGGSVNTAILRTMAGLCGPPLAPMLHTDLATLPHFDPDVSDEELTPSVITLRTAVGAAPLLVFSTPEYAGALPGAFKNLLDWTVGAPEMTGKSVAWINVSAGATKAAEAYASLATVMKYVGATVVAEACRDMPLAHGAVGADGLVHDEAARRELTGSIEALVAHVGGRTTVA
jgi:chromate reductase, NAD(P)H dehydrogenase (quinone)